LCFVYSDAYIPGIRLSVAEDFISDDGLCAWDSDRVLRHHKKSSLSSLSQISVDYLANNMEPGAQIPQGEYPSPLHRETTPLYDGVFAFEGLSLFIPSVL